ncbi:hypothetical protein HPB48_005044 [Haemaphysalis longicornis]|uniref:Tudor domain-containing protein n=1 Tax=Haemaphysalis longicornis TaxID=44386 RepID=A0A9J6GDU6_HAELO|nr:hypothetical protein HPB48_005044 [Haemaphysalis longicornis]
MDSIEIQALQMEMLVQFYRAIVHEVSANGNTCVVKFVDYGNHEEVLCSDVQTVSLAQWRAQVVDRPAVKRARHTRVRNTPPLASASRPLPLELSNSVSRRMSSLWVQYTLQRRASLSPDPRHSCLLGPLHLGPDHLPRRFTVTSVAAGSPKRSRSASVLFVHLVGWLA